MSLDDLQAQLRGALDQQFTALKSQFEQSLAESRREADAEAERQLGEKLAAARAEFDAQVQAAQAEAERRVVEAAELASQAEQQAADARDRTAVAEEQAAQAAERVTHAEQQAAQAGERATQAEQQASRAEQQSAQAFERLAHAEQRATELEQRASQAEQRIAHAERKTADAHRQVVEIATLQRQELEQQFQQLLEHHIARTSGEVRRTAELELAAEREQVRQEHDAERQRLLSERDAERQRLIEERDVERERLKRENEAERMRLQIELAVGHQQTLDEERQRLLRERDAERERLQTEREAERQRLQSEREAERQRLQSELEAEHQQAIDAERQRTKDALEAVRQRLQNDLDAERERALGAERQRANETVEAERQRLQAEFDAERRRSAEAEATRQGEIETERQRLQGEVAQAQAALAAADEQARTDLDALRMHLEGEIAVARAGAAAVVKAVSMPAAAGTGPDAGRIVGAIRALDDSTTLSETLDLLLNHTRALAGRAALFLIDGSRLKAWRGAGIPQVDVQTGESSIGGQDLLARAIQSGRAVQSGPDVPPPPFARLSAKGTALAMPVLLGGRAVAVLYADSGDGALPAGAPDLVDALLRHASTVLAVLTAQRTLDVVTGKPLNGGAVPDPNADDQSARRFARLLVSEIKLYNEAAVRDGRQHRDLLARLGPEIERARRLYEERVPGVGSRHMYFQQELVQTLADGDPSLLGNA